MAASHCPSYLSSLLHQSLEEVAGLPLCSRTSPPVPRWDSHPTWLSPPAYLNRLMGLTGCGWSYSYQDRMGTIPRSVCQEATWSPQHHRWTIASFIIILIHHSQPTTKKPFLDDIFWSIPGIFNSPSTYFDPFLGSFYDPFLYEPLLGWFRSSPGELLLEKFCQHWHSFPKQEVSLEN